MSLERRSRNKTINKYMSNTSQQTVTIDFSMDQQNVINWFSIFIEFFVNKKCSVIVNTEKTFENSDVKNCLNIISQINNMQGLEDSLFGLEESEKSKCYVLLWHCYWIMYMMNDTSKNFLSDIRPESISPKEELFLPKGHEIASTKQLYSNGLGSDGQRDTIQPYKYLLKLLLNCWNNNIDLKKAIEECDKKDEHETVKNILSFLMDRENNVCIASPGHRTAIQETWDNKSVPEIRDIINKITGKNCWNPFYDMWIQPLWQGKINKTNTDTPELEDIPILLEYKKAIVLYGPPGTGKTYSAQSYAEGLIYKEFIKKYLKDDAKVNSFSENRSAIFNLNDVPNKKWCHVYPLQLHQNYTYDDFIIGKTICTKNNTTQIEVKYGFILDLVSIINNNETEFNDLPFVVILDEINRVDLSRLFGELFSAIEYRGKNIFLNTKGENGNRVSICIPDNLYFIGTMNMIDFSLEQVDFALRRRFAWVESTYKSKSLYDIIESKQKEAEKVASYTRIDNKTIDDFVEAANLVNDHIKNKEGLGPSYKIGHTFFAEIVDLYKQLNDFNKAKSLLWNISIKPMIEAYCGTMAGLGRGFIKECEKAFKLIEA